MSKPVSPQSALSCTAPRAVTSVGAIWVLAAMLGVLGACDRGAREAADPSEATTGAQAEQASEPGTEAAADPTAAAAAAQEAGSAAASADEADAPQARDEADAPQARDERQKPTQATLDAVLAELNAGDHRVAVTLPEGVDFGERLPTVVWLHGYNWHPGTATSPPVQRIANTHQIAFIGISATTFAGTDRYQWVEDDTDLERVNSVLDTLLGEGPFEQSQMIAWGFSQGSTLSARLLAANPERWRGAIGLSSGAVHNRTPTLPEADLTGRHVFLSTGAGEREHIVALTEQLAADLRSRGATVDMRLVEGMSDHAMPPNFWQSMPELINGML